MTSVSDSLLQVITMNDDRERRARRAVAERVCPISPRVAERERAGGEFDIRVPKEYFIHRRGAAKR